MKLHEEKQPFPGLVLVDGGLGQLHAAADALVEIGITDQPLASIAKREEWIYVYGQEDEPIVLDKFSPILHLVQTIRDEAHRFAVTFHRTRRNAQRLTSELHEFQASARRLSRNCCARWAVWNVSVKRPTLSYRESWDGRNRPPAQTFVITQCPEPPGKHLLLAGTDAIESEPDTSAT